MSQESVSVIIPTKNAGRDFAELLSRVFAQKAHLPFEVIIIDSGSTDETLEIAHQFKTRILTIAPCEFNHGATRDWAIHHSSGTFIVLLVQDALPYDEQWLDKLIEPLVEDQRVAGTYSRHALQPGSSAFAQHYGMHYMASRSQSKVQRLDARVDLDLLTLEEKIELFSFSNTSSAIRRSVWEQCPFGNVLFGEDVCWAKRVMERGYVIYFQAESVVIHSHDRPAWYDFKRFVASYRLYRNLFGGHSWSLWFILFNAIPYGIYRNLFKLQHERYDLGVLWKAVTKGMAYPLGRYVGQLVHDGAHPWLRRLGDRITRGI